MPNFVLDIDPHEWKGVFETLYYYFDRDKDLKRELDISKSTLPRYRAAEKDSVDISIADRAIKLFNEWEPEITLEGEPDDYITGSIRQWGEERVELDEELQEFIFRPYQNTEIAEKADVSTRVAFDYRNAESRPPRDVFEECFEEVKRALEADFNSSGDIYLKSQFALLSNETHPFSKNSDALIFEDAGPEEIRAVSRASEDIEDLEEQNPDLYGGIINHSDKISTILEVKKDPLRGNQVSRKELGTSSSPFYRGMRELGALEQWGSTLSNYEIKASETYLKTLEYIFSRQQS